jgi:hypothetical protein
VQLTADQEFQAKKGAIEIELQKETNEVERQKSLIRQELDRFFEQVQKDRSATEQERRVAQIESARLVERMESQAVYEKKSEELASMSALQNAQKAEIEFRIQQARLDQDLALVVASTVKVRSSAEATELSDRALAGQAVFMETKKIEAALIASILDKLPAIMQSSPVRDTGQTTTIQIDRNAGNGDPGDLLGAFGLSILPVIRQFMEALPGTLLRSEADGAER